MMGVLAEAEKEIRFTNNHGWLLERTLMRLMPGNLSHAAGPRLAEGPPYEAARTPTMKTRPEPPPLAAEPVVLPKPPTPAAAQSYAETPPLELPEEAEVETAPAPESRSAPTPPPTEESARPAATTPAADSGDESRFAAEVTLTVIQRAWKRILALIQKASPSGASYLNKAEVIALEGHVVVLRFQDTFARDRIQNKGRELVEKKLNEGLQVEGYKIRCVLEGQEGGGGAAVPAPRPTSPPPHAAALEIPTLLDAPPPTETGPKRIADFDTHAAAPTSADYANTAKGNSAAPTPAESRKEAEEPSSGMLQETLSIFGGEVIHSEPL